MRCWWFTGSLRLIVGACLLAGTAPAYYYYVHYYSPSAPYNPIPEKFNISSLQNNSIPFFVSNQGPNLVPGDTFQAVVSEIRSAANVWNSVSSSQVQLAYGGLFTPGVTESAPGIQIEFSDDIPPGLLALSGPTQTANLAFDANGNAFVPIMQSIMMLPSDFTQVADYGAIASYSEEFFVTLVHEFGHTLGLQHTLASSVMSTLVTSASSKATPLAPDDIAAISMLYPAGTAFVANMGSISGQVLMQGAGVTLASVVAISATNPAITTLTNPDGTYQINGIPPGEYFVYVQPLPPAMQGEARPDNIVYPLDYQGNSIAPNYIAFGTEFYPAIPGQPAWSVQVTKGNVSGGINFNVNPLSSVAVSSVRTYAYSSTNVPITSGPLPVGVPAAIAASGNGLLQANNTLTPGLSLGLLGDAAQVYNLQPYPPPTPYVYFDVLVNLDVPGPKHLLFYTSNDMYVLPSGFTVVDHPAPSIASVTPTYDSNGNRAVLISGTQFGTGTTVLFDGLPGTVESTQPGSLLVTPPPASGNYVSTVVALNPDGQSSLFLSPTPLTYTYDPAGTPSITVSPSTLPPGANTTVTITGVNTNFIQGQTVVGFGSSDILVSQINVLSPTQLTAMVTTSVPASTAGVNVTTGLQIISQASGQQVTLSDDSRQ